MQQELQKISNSLERMEAVLTRVAASLEILSTRETQVLSGAASKDQVAPGPGLFSFLGSRQEQATAQMIEGKQEQASTIIPGPPQMMLAQMAAQKAAAQKEGDVVNDGLLSSISDVYKSYERSQYAQYEGPQQKLQGMAEELSKSGVVKSEDEWRQYAQFYQRTEFAAWQKNTEAVSVVTAPMQAKTSLTNEVGTEIFEIVKVVKGYIDSLIGGLAK